MSRLPDGHELLAVARELVLQRLLPALPEAMRYEALMVANAIAIAARELVGHPGTDLRTDEYERVLASAIRNGHCDEDKQLARQLRASTLAKLQISNPKAFAARQRAPPG